MNICNAILYRPAGLGLLVGKVMEVEFHNGAVYQYYDVTQPEYQQFLSVPSLGSALSKLDKIHRYRRVR